MIHVSELSKDRVNSPLNLPRTAKASTAMVLKVNQKEKKIALSVKSLERSGDYDRNKGYSSSESWRRTWRSPEGNLGSFGGRE